ncbi:MAG: CRISPR-associated endonuclease Cas2 [Melioribacteraceae bacterium]|nr:CRISPR-associated endonuclease Cas2 [Melioribacteraceae bacterium]
MYLIIVYDAAPKRGTKLLKFLRRHLMWIQNSVFEGEVTKAQLEQIKKGIKDIINEGKDSVIYYVLGSMKYTDRGVIGVERNETDSFI